MLKLLPNTVQWTIKGRWRISYGTVCEKLTYFFNLYLLEGFLHLFLRLQKNVIYTYASFTRTFKLHCVLIELILQFRSHSLLFLIWIESLNWLLYIIQYALQLCLISLIRSNLLTGFLCQKCRLLICFSFNFKLNCGVDNF